jgi:YbbR domain-containing protein
VDVEGSRSSIKRVVRLSADGKPLSFMPDQVSVSISIVEEELAREFNNVEVAARGAIGEYTLSPKSVHLRLVGPRRMMEKFELGADHVYVDIKGLPPGEHSVPLNLNLPADVRMLEQKPERIKVKINKG